VLIAAGAVQVPGRAVAIPTLAVGPVYVAGIPTPQQMMMVVEGQPFTIPAGKLFVVTGLGLANLVTGFGANLRFDDKVILTYPWSSSTPPFGDIPPGIVAPGGTVVSAETTTPGGTNARVLGYLVDA